MMKRLFRDTGKANQQQGGLTEEQRMEEGRRMFQIFAARMFEQRVLTAYREKVAAERQQKLLEELEEDERQGAQREAKKARDAEKKKSKKLAQKQLKAEEKARKDEQKAAEEAALRAEEERKQAEQRQRKEEQRRKKEAERKALEEERQRKEADKLKRQQEEKVRQQDAERKAREQKAQEKKQRDEARKREQDAKDAKDKKAQEDKDQRDREMRLRVEKDARETKARAPQPPQIIKRPSQAGAVAVPPGLHPKPSSSSIASPHIPVATPVIPKAATPSRPRQSSYQDSHGSSPMLSSLSTDPSKSVSPSSATEQQQPLTATPKTILQNPQKHQQSAAQSQPIPSTSQLPPPPGMHPANHSTAFGGMSMGFPPFQAQHGPAHQRQPMPMYPHQAPIGGQFRPFQSPNGVQGPPPPGMNGLGAMPHGRGFPTESTLGFQQHPLPPVGMSSAAPGFGMTRDTMPSHTRQHSASDKLNMDAPPAVGSNPPISRPAPIQRPSSIKPSNGGVDDLNKHLGSSALLEDDADDPLPTVAETRRTSGAAGTGRSGPMGFNAPLYTNMGGQNRKETFGNPTSSWSSPTTFGPPGLNSGSWGGSLNSTWGAPSSAFGSIGAGPRQGGPNRFLAIRLATCQACKQLSRPGGDDYHDVNLILRRIDANGTLHDSLPTVNDIQTICDTEGDAQNGGGTLHVRQDAGDAFSVKWEPDSATPSTGRVMSQLGEIGSPIPSNSMPAFGRGFGSIGGLGSLASPSGFGGC